MVDGERNTSDIDDVFPAPALSAFRLTLQVMFQKQNPRPHLCSRGWQKIECTKADQVSIYISVRGIYIDYDNGQTKDLVTTHAHLIDQNISWRAVVLSNQACGVVLFPRFFIWAQITFESLLAPGTLGWIANWRKSTDGTIFSRIFQIANERSVSAHAERKKKTYFTIDSTLIFPFLSLSAILEPTLNFRNLLLNLNDCLQPIGMFSFPPNQWILPVSHYALPLSVGRELGVDQSWKFFRDVRVHIVIGFPRFFRGVNIESCSSAEIVAIVFSRNFAAPCEELFS